MHSKKLDGTPPPNDFWNPPERVAVPALRHARDAIKSLKDGQIRAGFWEHGGEAEKLLEEIETALVVFGGETRQEVKDERHTPASAGSHDREPRRIR